MVRSKNLRKHGGSTNIVDLDQLVIDALGIDGEHHKQWFLEQIAEELGIPLDQVDYEPGNPP